MVGSMGKRALIAAALLALAGCGGSEDRREVRLLAPAGLVGNVTPFERETGCRVDLRVYDEGEDLDAIARRRDVDVIAAPTPPGKRADDSVELVRVSLSSGIEITVPKTLASAFHGTVRPAGRRTTAWAIREDGDNPDCAERWLDYATSRDAKAK
jgi:spermidine/putrescine-binding protein